MSITYTTTIISMTSYPQLYQYQNVVFTVNWTYTGTDGTYSKTYENSTQVALNPDDAFIPYNQLTQQQVLDWVNLYTDPAIFAGYQQETQSYITSQYMANSETLPLPWA